MSKLSRSTKVALLMPVGYLLLALAYVVIVLRDQPIALHHVIGATMTIVGFGLWIIARVQLGNAFSLAPKAKYLVTSGLYRKFRHPVYYCATLALIGLAVFSESLYAAAAVVTLIVLEAVRIRKEERLLEQTFGDEYLRYRKGTWF